MNRYIQYMYSYPHKTAYRPLSGVFLKDYVRLLAGSGNSLYVHIPFCQAKCGYCNLFSVTGQDTEAAWKYLSAVKRQSRQYAGLISGIGAEFSELVIGGGTPLYLSGQQLEQMFEMLKSDFRFSDSREFVIETAPNQTDAEKIRILKQQGVTRVSMGIQSFHDAELSVLGRQHSAKRAREALNLLKTADFPCINADFIYGIPGQTAESLLASLREVAAFEPDEIFLYPLYIKHGAVLEQTGVVPDQENAFEQYENASRFLRSEGFRQDSMRRFVRSQAGREFHDCGSGTSLSLGCGGRSYLGNLHFCTPYAITKTECLERIREFEHTSDFGEITHGIFLSDEEQKRRYIIRHLFVYPGLSLGRYQDIFKSRAVEDFPVLKSWIEKGFIRIAEDAAESVDRKVRHTGHEVLAGAADKKMQHTGREVLARAADRKMQHTAHEVLAGAADRKMQHTGREAYLALTETGLGLSDYLGPQLMSAHVRQAMEEWDAKSVRTNRHEWEESYGRAYGTIPGQLEKL